MALSFLAWDRAGFDIVAVQETWADRNSGRTEASWSYFSMTLRGRRTGHPTKWCEGARPGWPTCLPAREMCNSKDERKPSNMLLCERSGCAACKPALRGGDNSGCHCFRAHHLSCLESPLKRVPK
eukprot:278486-Chlamydomonas_euryale.AAC.1